MTPSTALTERSPCASPVDRPTPSPWLDAATPALVAIVRQILDVVAVIGGVLAATLLGPAQAGPAEAVAAGAFAVAVLVGLDPRRTLRGWLAKGLLDTGARAAGASAIGAMVSIATGALMASPRPDAFGLRLWAFTTALLCVLRTGAVLAERRARARGALMAPTLIVGAGQVGTWVARRLVRQASLGLLPIGFLDAEPPAEPLGPELGLAVLGAPADAVQIAKRTGARQVIVAFSLERDHALADMVRRCQAAGLAVATVPRLYESITDRVVLDHVGGLPLMRLEPFNPHRWQFAIKHAVDRIAALLALIVLSPLLAALAFGVKRSSPGPVVYRQRRVGRRGREFDLFKFRSMAPDTRGDGFRPALGLAPGGVEGTDRRTPIGRFLRNTSLDELPQLLNVLRGEMSLVGPRPERPEFVGSFSDEIPRYTERQRVRPGITGWAQVCGLRGQTSISDRVEWDNHYIDNWSLALELRSLLLTAAAMLRFREDAQPVAPTSAPAPAVVADPLPAPALAVVADPLPAPVLAAVPAAVCIAEPVPALVPVGAQVGADPERDAFLVIDTRMRVRSVSAPAEQLLGLEEAEARNRVIGGLLVDAAAELGDAESFPAAIARAASAGGEAWTGFVRPRGAFGIRARVRVSEAAAPGVALVVLEHVSSQRQLRPAAVAVAIASEA